MRSPRARGACPVNPWGGRRYHRRPLRRLIALVSLLVAVDLAMWSAIVPLLPYYRSELGLTKVESGWLLAAFSIAVVATSIPLGHLADRIGARRVVAAGAVAMAVATLGLGFAGSFWALLAARAVQGVGDAAVWGAGVAWVAARAPVESRGKAVSFSNAAAIVGVIAGPVRRRHRHQHVRDQADVHGGSRSVARAGGVGARRARREGRRRAPHRCPRGDHGGVVGVAHPRERHHDPGGGRHRRRASGARAAPPLGRRRRAIGDRGGVLGRCDARRGRDPRHAAGSATGSAGSRSPRPPARCWRC